MRIFPVKESRIIGFWSREDLSKIELTMRFGHNLLYGSFAFDGFGHFNWRAPEKFHRNTLFHLRWLIQLLNMMICRYPLTDMKCACIMLYYWYVRRNDRCWFLATDAGEILFLWYVTDNYFHLTHCCQSGWLILRKLMFVPSIWIVTYG